VLKGFYGSSGGFRRNTSTTDHVFCIRQILEKKREYNEAVHQLFLDSSKSHDSVRREMLYNIFMSLYPPERDKFSKNVSD
jgi:hypothetical protein